MRRLDLSQLVDTEGDYLFAYALRFTRERSIAEEVVQETFLAAVQGVKGFKGNSTPRTWLTSILRHKIIDSVRRASRETPVGAGPESDADLDRYFESNGHWTESAMPKAWSADPEKIMEQQDFVSIFEQCMSKLPQRLREVFLLRELDGLDSDELCNTLGLTATNLRVMLHRTRVHLRACLEENWFNKSGDT